jgi:hypothetical protein
MTARFLTCCLVLAFAGCANGPTRVTDPELPRVLPGDTPVAVRWNDPAQFTEIRYSRNPRQASEGDWVEEIAEYLQARTARALPTGERVEIDILDIERAGEYEWLRDSAQDIRVMRDLYPPRLTLQFRRYAADGHVIAQGERRLVDLAYLMGPRPISSSDTLVYEKRLIDRWIRREFGS